MRVPLFGLGNFAKSHNVTSQYRLNIYYEPIVQEDKTKMAAYGTAGLRLFVSFGETPCRGAYEKGDLSYYVHRNTFYSVDNSGVKVVRGALDTTSGRVSISDNGVQIAIVDGVNIYIYNTNTLAFTKVVSAGVPATPRTITFLAGFFIVTIDNSGRFYISAIYDGLTWSSLDFANAESNPDDSINATAINGQLVLSGLKTTEFWGVNGATFPFSNISGSAIEYGLASRFSIVKFDAGLMFLARGRGGEVSVRYMQGYQTLEVSNPEIVNHFNALSNIEASTAYSYTQDGHAMYVLNIGGETWMYDGLSTAWTQLQSNNNTRHIAECQTSYLNDTIVTDYANGNVYFLDKDYYTDNGAPIAREIVGRHIFDSQNRLFINEFQLDMETGTGITLGQGNDPQAMLQISKDNGHTYGNERWKPIGKIGEFLTRVIWRQLGFGRDFVFKIRITDPIKVVITGAYLDMKKGN